MPSFLAVTAKKVFEPCSLLPSCLSCTLTRNSSGDLPEKSSSFVWLWVRKASQMTKAMELFLVPTVRKKIVPVFLYQQFSNDDHVNIEAVTLM